MPLKAKRVFLLGILLAITLSVVMMAYVTAWWNPCLQSKEMHVYPYSIKGAFVDVYTQKSGKGPNMPGGVFGPQENVTLYAEVTNDTTPVPNKEVLFELNGPTNPHEIIFINETAITNASGIASTSFRLPWPAQHPEEITFGIWNVSTRVGFEGWAICDTLTFEVGWIVDIISVMTGTLLDEMYWIPRVNFTKGEQVDVKLTAKNIASTTKKVWFFITCIDKRELPIFHWNRNFTIPEKTTEDLFIQVVIPKWANVGKATVHANAYDGLPWEGGGCYCPEENAEFLIMEEVEDVTPPFIDEAFHEPELVQPNQEVMVSVNVTDSHSGVQEVILYYTADSNITWINVKMNKTTRDTFVGSIPGFPAENNVSYIIIAYDYAGIFAVNDNAGQYYVYTVIPEFPLFLILPLFMIATLLTVIVYRRIRISSKISKH